jgi:thymidylate kinase
MRMSAISDLGSVVSGLGERCPSVRKRPLLVELVGVAGAGKSTLCRVLHRRNPAVRPGFQIWHLPHSWLLVHSLLSMPTLLRCWGSCRWPYWEEATHIIRLRALRQFLRRESPKGYDVLALEEGAVYILAWLHAFGHAGVESSCMESWWRAALERWSARLDYIIWLDAPDALLAERIRSRSGQHPCAGWADPLLFEFFGRWRTGYQRAIAELTANQGPKVIAFATDQESVEQLAAKILTGINGKENTP